MGFTVVPLVSSGYLVSGTDGVGIDGTTVLKSEAWDLAVHLRNHEDADADFDAEVEAFFKPLTDAAEAHAKRIAGPANDWSSVTVGETVEGKTARHLELDENGVLLRILDETDGSSLRWVNGSLVAVL